MERQLINAPDGLFRSRLLSAALVCCALATVSGVLPVLALADPEYRQLLVQKLITSGITSGSAVITWSVINGVISLLCVICPGLLAGGLALALHGSPAKGFGFLSTASAWGLRTVNGTGILLAGTYLFRAVRYVIVNLNRPQGMMNIYAMILMEGLMGVLAWFLFRCLRRFVEGFSDASASMAYTLSSGRIDNQSIPGSAERGFLVLGILCPLWAVSQTVTMTAVVTRIHSYYTVVLASHPMEWLTAAALVFNGAASILMCLYLRRYNRICEWEKYQARRRK